MASGGVGVGAAGGGGVGGVGGGWKINGFQFTADLQ